MADKVPSSLNRKMLEVMSKVERVPKNGENKFHNYKYVTESDMVDYLRPMLAAAGVMVWTSIEEITVTEGQTAKGSRERIARVKLSMTFADSESSESHTVIFYGEGADASDKACYKAITGAEKYALMKTLLVSTGDDPERDEHLHGAHAVPAKPPAAPSRSEQRLAEAREHIAKPVAPPAATAEGENGADPTEAEDAPAPKPAPATARPTAKSPSDGEVVARKVYVNKEWPEKSGTSKKGQLWTKYSFAFRDAESKEMFSAATFSSSQADDMRAHISAKRPVDIDFEKNGEYWNIAPDGSE